MYTQRFTKAHAQASSRFSVSPFLTYTHTHTHTHTHRNMAVGDVLVVLVLGDSAIATTQLLHHLLEYRKRDKQTPTVFVSFTSSCITGISFFCFFLNEKHTPPHCTHTQRTLFWQKEASSGRFLHVTDKELEHFPTI